MVNNIEISKLSSYEAECSAIGGVLLDSRTEMALHAVEKLKPEHFYHHDCRVTWQAIAELTARDIPADLVTVMNWIEANGNQVEFSTVGAMARNTPSASNMRRYVDIIIEQFKLRDALTKCLNAIYEIQNSGDPSARLASALSHVSTIGADETDSDIKDPVDVMSNVIDMMERAQSSKSGMLGISSGFENIDKFTNGFQAPDLIVVAAPPSMGKELQNSAVVYMMNGTSKPIVEIMVGDKVASVDGKISSVVGVYPQGVKDIYRVTFSDGRAVNAGLEHQWEVNHKDWSGSKVLTTAELIAALEKPSNKNRLCIPLCSGDFGEDNGINIPAYLLGALLGDGGLSQKAVNFSNPDDFIIEKVSGMLGGLTLKNKAGIDYSITSARKSHHWLIEALKSYGLYGLRSHEKFIPEAYFSASRKTRLDLINGLIDTDGTIEKHGTLTFTSTSEDLADGFVKIARSLGYWAKKKSRVTKYTYKGQKLDGKTSYTITVQGDGMEELVTLPRKKDRIKNRLSKRNMNVSFKSIEKIGADECTCIMVDHEKSLFLTDDYIVTHNTTFSLNFAEHAAFLADEPKNVLIFSLEMSAEQLMQKTIANLGSLYLNKIKTGKALESDHDMGRLAQAQEIIYKRRNNFRIDDKGGQTIAELQARAKRTAMKMGGIDLIVVDYLHLIAASSAKDGAIETLTKNINGLKNLAKQLKCPVIVLSQLNRAFTGRPEMKNLLGSSIIEQAADIIFFLHDEDYQGQRGDHSITEVIVAKNRMGETGSTFLQPELGMSRFRDTQRLPAPPQEPEKKKTYSKGKFE